MQLFDEEKYGHLPHYLSLGAGVQSSTLALMYATGELEPMPKAAIFADTEGEPEAVYRWLGWLESQLPYPIHRVSKGSLRSTIGELRTKENGEVWSASNIPFFTVSSDGEQQAMLTRQCTLHYKIRPINKALRKLAGVKRGEQEPVCVSVIGISLDEFNRAKPSREKWLVNRHPLVNARFRRQQCLDWLASHGFPTPPRSACSFCAFKTNKEWRELQVQSPSDFDAAVQTERELRNAKKQNTRFEGDVFLHHSCKPLDQIDFRSDVERGQQLLWDDECEGMCGV